LYSATSSSKGRIFIGGIIAFIARFSGIQPKPHDRVRGSEWLDKATFELLGLYQVAAGRLYWMYLGGRLMPLSNIERITLQKRNNFLYLSGDEELLCPTPPIPHSSYARSSSSS